MKILLISHIFPPAIDGGSKVIFKLGQYFESQNHQTLYISSNCSSTDDFVNPKYKISKALTLQSSNVLKIPVYHCLRRPLKFLNLFFNSDLLKTLQKGPIFKIIPLTKACYKIIKFKPDLIVAGPLPTTIVLYATFFKTLTNALTHQRSKVLINASFHSTDPDFQQIPLINSLKKADYLWTLTQVETDYFIKNFNIKPQKIILAGNGVDSKFLKTKVLKIQHSNALNILFIGSLASHKRVDLLIKSFSNLTSEKLKSEISLTIAGQKTLFYPQIKKLLKTINPKIKSKIKFIFNFPQQKLVKLIDSCDVLVLPSIQESFGLVIIEAWARQKPVICADIPALKELIKKTDGGLLFKTDNQLDLSQKIKFILDNPKKAWQMGQNGYQYVKNNYTWSKVGKKICQKIS